MKMKNTAYAVLMALAASTLFAEQIQRPPRMIEVTNPTDDVWVDAPVRTSDPYSRSWDDGYYLYGPEILPAQQIPATAEGSADEILFLVSLGPGETKRYQLKPNASTYEPPDRAHVAMHVPGYEGPGWESDKLAFRLYWDERNAIDIFAKRTGVLGLEEYARPEVNYHTDTAWGMDVLKVGQALGAGGFGIWDGEKIQKVSDATRDYEIITNGPLEAVIRLKYTDWKVGDRTFDLTADMRSIAGQNYSTIDLTLMPLDGGPAPEFVVGVVKHEGTQLVKDEKAGVLGRWGKQALGPDETANAANLGLGVIVPADQVVAMGEDEFNSHVRLKGRPAAGNAVTLSYKSHASWEHEPGAADSAAEYEAKLQKIARMKPLVKQSQRSAAPVLQSNPEETR